MSMNTAAIVSTAKKMSATTKRMRIENLYDFRLKRGADGGELLKAWGCSGLVSKQVCVCACVRGGGRGGGLERLISASMSN